MAVGARASTIARPVTAGMFLVVFVGATAGLGLGMISAQFVGSLLYQVKPTDWTILAFPWLMIIRAALVAAVAPVLRAVRIDLAANRLA